MECRFGATFETSSRNVGGRHQNDPLSIFHCFRRTTCLPIFDNKVAPFATGSFLEPAILNNASGQHSGNAHVVLEFTIERNYFLISHCFRRTTFHPVFGEPLFCPFSTTKSLFSKRKHFSNRKHRMPLRGNIREMLP